MKNSSRLLAEIARNRSLSSSGCASLDASSRTRRLKLSQDSSRLTKRFGSTVRETPPSDSDDLVFRERVGVGCYFELVTLVYLRFYLGSSRRSDAVTDLAPWSPTPLCNKDMTAMAKRESCAFLPTAQICSR